MIGMGMGMDGHGMDMINTGMVMGLMTGMHVNVVRMVMRPHVSRKSGGDQSALGPQHT